MAMQAERMSYDNLKEIVDGLSCRSISPLVMPEVPPGSFDLASFPILVLFWASSMSGHFRNLVLGSFDAADFGTERYG